AAMDLDSSGPSPKEEGELEDGEINSDEEKAEASPRSSYSSRRPDGLGGGGGSSSSSSSCSRSRLSASLSSSGYGYRPAVQFRSRPPPLRMQPGSGPLPDHSPRSSFWERSHDALGKFNRFRGGSNWGRWGKGRGGWRGKGSGRPPGGPGPFGGNINRRESPPRKHAKQFGRLQLRKPSYQSKLEYSGEETFEDLLMKYKQIQHELECISKEEKVALTCKEENLLQADAALESRDPSAVDDSSAERDGAKHVSTEEKTPRPFQAFELKPLRQKLPTPAERDKLNKLSKDATEQGVDADFAESSKAVPGKKKNLSYPILESRELGEKKTENSERERLLMLKFWAPEVQPSSRSWNHGKVLEFRILKKKKKKTAQSSYLRQSIASSTKSFMFKMLLTPPAKQALRRQQTRAWKKLQQQKEQEKHQRVEEAGKKRAEDEERRKREEEIRKIRDLSNQEEQYNRFMKLVGSKKRSSSKSSDVEIRKSLDRQSADAAGSLYQYDNYDEVAMDTDSETNSPALSPVHPPFSSECPLGSFLLVPQVPFPVSPQVSAASPLYVDNFSSGPQEPPPPPPPLPLEEPEQPPKPPFADEEEEEEMLLREELLKSLANKRSFRPEETLSNSDPPSPSIPNSSSQFVPRNNLSTVSINTVPQPRLQSTKLVRAARASRPVVVLPKHKSVVVRLDDSDDSESDGEHHNCTAGVFGGLESMIKEARRTAEQALKPKIPSRSEKENDPMRTPEALPEDKKIEYRLLKEEIASREKQRLLKSDHLRCSPSPANSDVELEGLGKVMVVTKHVSEAEAKLKKHETLLAKDESLLKHLLQQEAKKRESVRVAETKFAKLREQLLATEKIMNANKVLLKKLQEQIHRVQHRVSLKKSLSLKYGEELARAKAFASQALGKRKIEPDELGPNKATKLDNCFALSPKKHSAELIALEKRRLQQLELEYAQKIQKLREAQAGRVKEHLDDSLPNVEEEQDFVVPQPSLHDLTQDKLVLDTGDEVDEEVLSLSVRERRRSFRESTPFTKPNLKHTDTLVSKECVSKPAKKAIEEPELFLGLNIDDLKKIHAEADSLKDLLQKRAALLTLSKEKPVCGQEIPVDLDVALQTKPMELKPAPFGPYHSPLLAFKSYRFSPYFRTKEKLFLSSVSYSNMIEPKKCFCRFDLTGTCNDDDCQWQHMRDCTLSRNQLFQDILSYNLPLIGCSESSTDEEIRLAAEKYVDKLFGVNKDRMPMDQMAVLLISKINESKGHIPPYTTRKDKRKWRPKYYCKRAVSDSSSSSDDEQNPGLVKCVTPSELPRSDMVLDTVITPDDVRYFTNETDEISNLEGSVDENPRDAQLWIKLAYKYLNQKEGSSSERLDSALNVLARALEDNRENSEIWCHYLNLFSKRGTKEEIQEMCETAVEYAPSYQVWWTFLNLETSFDGKDYVCSRMLQSLMEAAEGGKKSDLLSFQLLEALLFRVQLSHFTGRHQNALALLQNALKSSDGKSIAEHLTRSDCCLAWLALIHLLEFNSLPGSFYDPANTNPSRMVDREPFLIPWQSKDDVKTDPTTLLALFEDAVSACSDDSILAEERIAVCLPLYRNKIVLQQLLGRWEAAVKLCEMLLKTCPTSCQLLDALAESYLQGDQIDTAIETWLSAFRMDPHNAQLFYHTCKWLILKERSHIIIPLFKEFVTSFFESTACEQSPIDYLRYLLNFPMPYDFQAPTHKEQLNDELLNRQVLYLWLIYCLWQSLHASLGEAVNTFEAALSAVMQQDVLQKIWLDYLIFTNNKLVGSRNKPRDFKHLTDLVHRCLVTFPTRYPIPFSSADYWTSYEFHNTVISFYVSCFPQSQHSKALERFRSVMPANAGLALRLLQQEWEEGNLQLLKLQAKMFTHSIPNCLTIWKIAIAVEGELKGQKEVRRLYQRVLQKLPLCAALWKDQLVFEASEGGKSDILRKLVSKCQEVGVSLDELLSLNVCRAEDKTH
uniref:Zinc finger C3H1-type containing n=1 Tax=Latimeria chalumnae TaxID=7897 RepID=H2ZZS1_LATCH